MDVGAGVPGIGVDDLEVEAGSGFGAGAAAFGGEVAADESADEFVDESHAVSFVGTEGEEGGDFIGVEGFLAVLVDGGSGREGFAFALELLDAAHGDGGGGPIDDDGESVSVLGRESPGVWVGAESGVFSKKRNDFGESRGAVGVGDVAFFGGFHDVATAPEIVEGVVDGDLSDSVFVGHFDAAVDGVFKALYVQGEDILQSDPNTKHVSAGLAAMECVIVHDLFLNETAHYAHIFLPGSTFLEKNGTFTNAERRIQPVRKVMTPMNGLEDWEVTQALAKAMGLNWNYTHPSEIMDEIARLTPTFAGVSFDRLDEEGSLQWPVNDAAPDGSPIMHVDGFVRGKGKFVVTDYVPTDEKTGPRFPLLLTTGRILSHYNVGAQTRRTENVAWHPEDLLEIHPIDAEDRGVKTGDWVKLASRSGETTLRATVTDRVAPGVVYTTFHHPATQANVVTTDYSEWATNCPEYKVTAVQISASNGPTDWQEEYEALSENSRRIATKEPAE